MPRPPAGPMRAMPAPIPGIVVQNALSPSIIPMPGTRSCARQGRPDGIGAAVLPSMATAAAAAAAAERLPPDSACAVMNASSSRPCR